MRLPDSNLTDGGICVVCGYSHLVGSRRARLKRLLLHEPRLTTHEIADLWPCPYPPDQKKKQGGRHGYNSPSHLLLRDLHAIGAVQVIDLVWELP